MNESNDPITGELLDHLVEDELELIQRKRIIASLDSEPDGWRRCALAFLEKQSWQRSLRQFVDDKSCDEKSVLPTTNLNDKRTRSTKNWKTIPIDNGRQPTTDQLFWAGMSGMVYLPSTVAPAGLTRSGLPCGLQIVAPYLEDHSALEFARLMEQELGGFRPPPRFD